MLFSLKNLRTFSHSTTKSIARIQGMQTPFVYHYWYVEQNIWQKPMFDMFYERVWNWVEFTKSRFSGKHSREKEFRERHQSWASFFFAWKKMRLMFYYCAVALCTNSSKNRPDLSFHTFPKDVKRKRVWKIFCGQANKDFQDNSSIRKVHFTISFQHKPATINFMPICQVSGLWQVSFGGLKLVFDSDFASFICF